MKGTFTGWVDETVTIWSGDSIYFESSKTSSYSEGTITTIQNNGYFRGIYVDFNWERWSSNSSNIVIYGGYKTDSASYWTSSKITENASGSASDYRITRTHDCWNDDTVTIGFPQYRWCKLWVTKVVGKKEWS